jgi:predicted histone-like DNA-binding protein
MISIHLNTRNDPRAPDAPKKVVAKAVTRGLYTFDMMADDISHSCSLTRADVVGCMEALIDHTMRHLDDGYTVDYRGLGRFQLIVDSGWTTPEEAARPDFRPASLVKSFRLRFLPNQKLQKRLRATATTEVVR